jgi:hypothetical protein
MRDSVLYFPHIEINGSWLKSALLLWEHVYRIVPKDYTPDDSDQVKEAVDGGLVRPIRLEQQDMRGFTQAFLDFVDSLDAKPSGLMHDEISHIHPDKIDSHLYPILEQCSDGWTKDGWIRLPREVARGYMFFLANQVAHRRHLSRCTDSNYCFSVSAYFSEDGNFGDFLRNPDAEGFYSSLILRDLLPIDTSGIPMKDIITVSSRSRDERKRFRSQLSRFSDELHSCQSVDHAKTVLNDYKADLISAKNALKASQGFMNKDDTGALLIMGLPTALTAYGALVSASADPFGLHTISTSLLVGAIAAYQSYKYVKCATKNPYGAAYLISLEEAFAKSGQYPALDRHLEEFVND